MFRKILVPLDGSRLAARIIHPLRKLLERDAEVTLLRVVEPGWSDAEAREPAAEAHMRAQMAQVLEVLGPGVRAEIALLHGDPAEEIVRFATGTRQDLVAMATHGYSGIERWVRGSVAERVLRGCEVPVLLCNPHGLEPEHVGPFKRILAPLDGSEVADRILPLVEDIARLHGSHVTLLRVEPLILTEFPSPIVEGSLWDPAPLERALQPQRDRMIAAGIETDVRAVYGVVAAEILEAARTADLLAMTSHGRSGLSRWWFGSVAEQVLRQVTCPVVVMRHVREPARRVRAQRESSRAEATPLDRPTAPDATAAPARSMTSVEARKRAAQPAPAVERERGE